MELLDPAPSLVLDDATWPIGTVAAGPRAIESPIDGARRQHRGIDRRAPLRHRRAGVPFGCSTMSTSGRGASVTASVVLPGARIGAGTRLRGIIVDAGYRVAEGAVFEGAGSTADPLVLSDCIAAGETSARYALAR